MISRRYFLAVNLTWPLYARLAAAAPQDQRNAPLPVTKPGRYPLTLEYGRDGLLYVPRGYKPGVAMPLVVLLHGAAGSADAAASTFELADELGFVILAPESREWTWDALIPGGGGYGADVEFLGSALALTKARCAIDKARIALAGFSDGASYALSLGISNGDIFPFIMAFSPGVMQPLAVNGKPRLFISHGTADRTMPIDETSRTFVPRLKALGYDVTYREYDGGHTVPPAIRREAFEWFIRIGGTKP